MASPTAKELEGAFDGLRIDEEPVSQGMPDEPQPSDFKLRELAGEMDNEMLLKDNPGRYVIFPIQHQDVSLNYDFPARP